MSNPYSIVHDFEAAVADYAGSTYAVAVESCSAALFLSCLYRKRYDNVDFGSISTVTIPSHTYPSVPCAIIHAGFAVEFVDIKWNSVYNLDPLHVMDSALRFRPNMYRDARVLYCLSFHSKKHIPIGRGGMILTDSYSASQTLRLLRFDGRTETPLQSGNIKLVGWNMYMAPEQAARGLELLRVYIDRYPKGAPDLLSETQEYPDLSKYTFYKR